MKKIKLLKIGMLTLAILVSFSVSSCVVHSSNHHHKTKNIPPGHAKKISGDKSAKKHARGHKK
ncbi:hypothetical protein [Flavobacterium adhaerens]|uniref:hypothetical protein n=1 Tax=Flavobacterium adhaerens TaxID=3149043 RepID=UPI0032B48ED3